MWQDSVLCQESINWGRLSHIETDRAAPSPVLERQFFANSLCFGLAQHVYGGVEVFRGDAL